MWKEKKRVHVNHNITPLLSLKFPLKISKSLHMVLRSCWSGQCHHSQGRGHGKLLQLVGLECPGVPPFVSPFVQVRG